MRGLEKLKLIDDGGSFDRLVKKNEELAYGNKSDDGGSFDRLVKKNEELAYGNKSDDGGSFDRLVKKYEELAYVNKSLSQKLLTKIVLEDLITTKRYRNLNIAIPKKIRSKRYRHASRIESSKKSATERCCLGVVEEEGQTVKKPGVKKQRKADRVKKKRKASSCLAEEDRKKKRRTTIMKDLDNQLGLNPPPDLPKKFKDRIKRMNGTNVTLVTQKEITGSDKNDRLARFSIPNGQVRSHEFLTDEEAFKLNQKGSCGISCSLIQPCLKKITDLEFKKWDMNKTFIYSLIKKWKSVANYSKNQLTAGCNVQLWSFRVNSKLWFAMVKLE